MSTTTGPNASVAPDEDWHFLIDDIDIGPQIGKGSFGTVYRGNLFGKSGTEVAVKEIPKTLDQIGEFDHEVAMLKYVYTPIPHYSPSQVPQTPQLVLYGYIWHLFADIVLFMGITKNADKLYLVQEFVTGGSLWGLLQQKQIDINWKTRVKIALEIAQALQYLHKKNCLHRDLKCENVLIEFQSESTTTSSDNFDANESFVRCKVGGLHAVHPLPA
mgnify:CR=1 FL=1